MAMQYFLTDELREQIKHDCYKMVYIANSLAMLTTKDIPMNDDIAKQISSLVQIQSEIKYKTADDIFKALGEQGALEQRESEVLDGIGF